MRYEVFRDAYIVERDLELKLRRRIEALNETLSRKQTVHLTLITTCGVAYADTAALYKSRW